MRFKIQFSSAKNYFLGFATSGLFLIGGLYYFSASEKPNAPPPRFSESVTAENASLKAFDPNALDATDWQQLGFSEKQVNTILKYKKMLGGSFSSKQQIKECFVISEEKYHELQPYLLLPDSGGHVAAKPRFANYYGGGNYSRYELKHNRKELTVPGKFNPDLYSEADFERLGFSERQAASIVKYRRYLGGSFISKEKFKECFIISDENYRKLAPYLLLPEKTPASAAIPNFSTKTSYSSAVEAPRNTYEPFDPNTLDLNGWRALGFSEKQAQVIINYRDHKLKGSFRTLADIENCFVISAEKFAALKPYIILSNTTAGSNPAASPTAAATKNPTDFSKVDLNEITFRQLIEFGFDERSAASFIGFRNKLGGFVTKEQILDTYNIDKELAQKLVAIAPLITDRVAKYTLADAPEEWLKSHPYFKYYADKIIYNRITYRDDRKIMKNINAKPDAEKRMKLYMK